MSYYYTMSDLKTVDDYLSLKPVEPTHRLAYGEHEEQFGELYAFKAERAAGGRGDEGRRADDPPLRPDLLGRAGRPLDQAHSQFRLKILNDLRDRGSRNLKRCCRFAKVQRLGKPDKNLKVENTIQQSLIVHLLRHMISKNVTG